MRREIKDMNSNDLWEYITHLYAVDPDCEDDINRMEDWERNKWDFQEAYQKYQNLKASYERGEA